MKERDRNKKFTKVLAALCFVTTLALLLSSLGATLAKYIRQDSSTGAAVAVPFYFSSDKLSEGGNYYKIDDPTVNFKLYKYIDKLRCTDGDVTYTYWAVTGSYTSWDPTGQDPAAASTAIAGTEKTGTLSGDFGSTTSLASCTISLRQSDFGSDGVVTVFARSDSPYDKLISAQFGFAAQKYDLQWTVEDKGSAVVLELAGGSGANVTVDWPDELSPDLSNEVFHQGVGLGTATFAAEPGVRYALTFLKSDPAVTVTKEMFTVTQAE